MRRRFVVRAERKIQTKTIIIVLAIILVILCVALAFVISFALNPSTSFPFNNLFQGSDVEEMGNSPVSDLSPMRESQHEYSAMEYDWKTHF